jgi:hypothetical protein
MTTPDEDNGFETAPELQQTETAEETPPPKGPAPSKVPLLLGAILILAVAVVLIYFIAR